MTYKFLNTIIDDLFAFVIKMPTMHRLAVFRDDLVFLIFLYQRWIYRVDKTRVNGEPSSVSNGSTGSTRPACVASLVNRKRRPRVERETDRVQDGAGKGL